MRELRGKVAVVTGGASGIGYALAERFCREGMSVVVADIESTALDDAVRQLKPQELAVTGVLHQPMDGLRASGASSQPPGFLPRLRV